MTLWPESTQRKILAGVTTGGLLMVGLAACGSSPSSSAGTQVSASAKQTIVFATQGLGSEGTATTAAVQAFEKLHPNISVQILRPTDYSQV